MKLLILITALLASVSAATAGQTCVTRNGYTYCGDSYGSNQNCIKEGSMIRCY